MNIPTPTQIADTTFPWASQMKKREACHEGASQMAAAVIAWAEEAKKNTVPGLVGSPRMYILNRLIEALSDPVNSIQNP